MSSGLYRIYTKGDGYVTPIKKWLFVGGFVDLDDAREWVSLKLNDVHPEDDIDYKIMHNGKLITF